MDIDKLEKMYNAGCKEGYQHEYNDTLYTLQYGDTSKKDDLDATQNTMEER